MKSYKINFYSECYERWFSFEIDEENEKKISLQFNQLLGTRESFLVENLIIDFIDDNDSFNLVRALEKGKLSYYSTTVNLIECSIDKYYLGRMLVEKFTLNQDYKILTLDVIFNHGKDILKRTEEKQLCQK